MSNSGVFSVNDIRYLMDYQQYPKPGELELIETQTVSSVGFAEFPLNGVPPNKCSFYDI